MPQDLRPVLGAVEFILPGCGAPVAGDLFNVPMSLDAGFTIEFVDAGVGGDWVGG